MQAHELAALHRRLTARQLELREAKRIRRAREGRPDRQIEIPARPLGFNAAPAVSFLGALGLLVGLGRRRRA